jgi:hypothetical protein
MSEQRSPISEPQYIIVVTFGDPNSHLAQATSLGMFDSIDEATAYFEKEYEGTNHICEVVPLNVINLPEMAIDYVLAKMLDESGQGNTPLN